MGTTDLCYANEVVSRYGKLDRDYTFLLKAHPLFNYAFYDLIATFSKPALGRSGGHESYTFLWVQY